MELLLFFLFIVVFLLLPLRLLLSSIPEPDEKILKAYPVIGNLPQFLKHRKRILEWQTELLAAAPTNTLHIQRLGGVQGVVTANPANIEHVLKSNFENYPKGPRNLSILEDFLGRGIFNSDGEIWRMQRKTASFEFNTKSLRNFVVENVQREITARLMPLLRRAAASGAAVDLQDVLERFAFDNVCQVAFNEDPACLAENSAGEERRQLSRFAAAFRDAATISGGRFQYAIPRMWKITKLLNIGSERRLREAVSAVDDFALKIIRSRKDELRSPAATLNHQDLLSRFMAGDDNSDRFLRDVVISFILAGRETTSSALAWFFWLLSQRPDVETKILEEIRSGRARSNEEGDDGKKDKNIFRMEDLREMNYLHAAISEAMRLFPPVPVNNVYCRADDVLPDGTQVRKGGFVVYNSYAMGRMKTVWGDDCCEFRPERWLSAGGTFQPESPFRYPVFHAGPRTCLGKEMAYIQMKSVAAALIENFTVEVIGGGSQPEMLLSLTLRMKGGLSTIIRERNPS